MLIKTMASRADSVIARVRALHSYDNPALVVVPVEGGSADFLAWIAAQTAPT
jgi:periplasmic divalent cation tolerance protein